MVVVWWLCVVVAVVAVSIDDDALTLWCFGNFLVQIYGGKSRGRSATAIERNARNHDARSETGLPTLRGHCHRRRFEGNGSAGLFGSGHAGHGRFDLSCFG
jgi:hypothetical protein